MAGVRLDGVSRVFGQTRAVDRVSMTIPAGDFVALLGPSGCGKTTLLRLLAGFEPADEGTVAFDDQVVSGNGGHVPPERRRVGMVFQAYALWPHMTVAENVGFALKVRRLPAAERRNRVGRALETVGMAHLAERRPDALSGGQRQRVALARCLAMEPAVVLLDEPLANLDVHLRDSMQEEFRRFHRATGATMVYVTHDQAEAMALADRIAVMDRGVVQQFSDPATLYGSPETAMVAEFVGRGMVVPVTLNGPARADGRRQADLWGMPVRLRTREGAVTGSASACLRQEGLRLADQGETGLPATVARHTFHGASTTLHLRPTADPERTLTLRVATAPPPPGAEVLVAVDDGWLLPA